MESAHENKEIKEKAKKQPSAIDRVDGLIAKKGAETIRQSAEGVQTEVADLMSGVEAPSQTISERKEGAGDKGGAGSGSVVQQDDNQSQTATSTTKRAEPNQEVMIKKVRTAIRVQIKHEQKKAKKLKKNLSRGSAQEYNTAIAKIRQLQQTLKTLLTGTLEVVKGFYSKYFNADGRRKGLEEV